MRKQPQVIGSDTTFFDDVGDLTRKHTQYISQDFLDDLRDSRNASTHHREGNYMRVASIPVVIVEKWLREGFDIFQADGREIVKRLKNEDLTAFMATEKSI